MSPKEKANQLVNTYYNSIMSFLSNNMKLENAKKGALIAVDEIITQFVGVYDSLKDAGVLDSTNVEDSANYKYWQEVKQEIKNI